MKNTRLRLNLFFFILSLCSILPVSTQPLCHIEHYSINDGLAQGVVMGYVQDSKGHMWFATWNGLNKFDGYTFQTFKARSGDGATLESNRIEFINKGIYDWIWCRTYDQQAYIFNPGTHTFIDVLDSIPRENARVRRLNALPKGVVWLICDDGFCYRIDEAQYRTAPFVGKYGVSHQNLKGHIVYNILQDSQTDEWILTDNGATIIGKKAIRSHLPFRYFQEVDNEIFLATGEGILAHYNKQTEDIRVIHLPFSGVKISGLRSIDNRTLAVATVNHGLILYDTVNRSFEVIDLRTPGQPSNDVQSMYVDKHEVLWISTASDGAVYWDHPNRKLCYLPPLPSNHIEEKFNNTFFVFEDINDQLWIHPKGGNFNLYDRKNNKLQYFYSNPDDPNALLGPSIHSYFSDKQGNLWINTVNRELEKIHFFNTPFSITDLGAEARSFFYDRDQRLWIATKDKKIRIYGKEEELLGYLNRDGRISREECNFGANAYCITYIGDEIWIGTSDNGLFVLRMKKDNPNNYTVKQYIHNPADPFSLSHDRINSIYQDSQKHIWVGSFEGGINLVQYTAEGEIVFINSRNHLSNYFREGFSKIRCISETVNGNVLVGTTKGLVSFSSQFTKPEDIKFYTHTRRPNDETSLSNNNVIHICNTTNNETYISTLGGGINKVVFSESSSDSIRFQSYNQASGLTFDWALSSTEDKENRLWIVSENMLSKFNPDTGTFDNYRWNLLKTDMFYSEAPPLINRNGELLLGINKGFITLSIEQISKSLFVPTIVLTHIKIFNQEQFIPTDGLAQITLYPRQRNITIDYAALDFADPDNISYAYMLEGLDTDWNYAGKKRSISYINLPHGKYNLLIKSTNSDGVWVDNEYKLAIEVVPKFVETIWFVFLATFLLVILVVVTVYILFYIYRLQHRVDIEQQITDIKLRFFTNISHELRTPLTLIIGPVSELLNEDLPAKAKGYLHLIERNTDRMLRLINQILDFRKIQNQKMKLFVEEVDIVRLIPTLMEHFQLMATDRKIDFRFVSDDESLVLWMDVDKMEKVIFNLLSNAFKYTPNGKSITIKIESNPAFIHLSIIDEGCGISPHKVETIFQRFETIINRNLLEPSSGIGLSLTKELVGMHHGNIKVTSEPGVGSCFCVTLPRGKEHFNDNELIEFILSDSKVGEDINPADTDSNIETPPHDRDKTGEKISILLVEDNETLRHFLRDILAGEYDVIEAENGHDGVLKAQQHLPGIIISDVMMPVMDGLDMVKAIKEDTRICHLPIVLLSAKSSLDDRIKGLEYGIDDYITKPFSTTYLKVRIASIIKTRRQIQEQYRNTLFEADLAKPDITPTEPPLVPYDKIFIEQLMALMEEHMSNSELVVEDLARSFAMGRTVFYNKVKTILGITPIEFINEVRIKRAVQLLNNGERNISQVAYTTGFNDPKYFSRCFKKHTGMTPVQYRELKNT